MNNRFQNGFIWLCLIVGSVLTAFSLGSITFALAPWLAPIFLIRFIRKKHLLTGLVVTSLFLCIATILATHGFMEFPMDAVFGLTFGLTFSFALAVDRFMASRLVGLARTLVYPATVTILDWLWSFGPYSNWWSPVYPQATFLPIIQMTSLTGLWGLTFLTSWLGPIVNELLESPPQKPSHWRVALPFTAVLVLALIFGVFQLSSISTSAKVTVAALPSASEWQTVTGEIPWDDMSQLRGFQRPLLGERMSQVNENLWNRTEAAIRKGAQIVAWPEGGALLLKEDELAFLARASDLARRENVYLQLGIGVFLADDRYPYIENRNLLIGPDGQVLWDYHKSHLAPGEDMNAQAGPGRVPIVDTSYGRLAGVICFDMDLPSIPRQAGQEQTAIIFAPSNDWESVADTHARVQIIHAVSNGLSLVRATNNGITLLADPHGRVLAQANFFTEPESESIADLPVNGVFAPAAWLGDGIAYISLIILSLLVISAMLNRNLRDGKR